MAIRFDKGFNREIRREVDKINRKYARAREMGLTRVPQNISIRELKEQFSSRYATRRELRRRLSELSNVRTKDLSKVVELETGARVSLSALQLTEKHRRRLVRKMSRELREQKAIEQKLKLPFAVSPSESIEHTLELLKRGSRTSESQMRMINELYAREYSSRKKDSFEDALYDTIESQLVFSKKLTDAQKNELMQKLRNIDVDTLIKMNKNDSLFKQVLDKYKGRDDYNAYDKKTLANVVEDIYRNLDSIVAEYSE